MLRGCLYLWPWGHPHSCCPQSSSLVLPPPALNACFLPPQPWPAAGLAWVMEKDASSPPWLYTGPAPSCGFQAQPSLLKGGSLTWNEMLPHLPSSTHSGDKHSSIPKRPCLRQGTDRAVHQANKAREGPGQGSWVEVGRGRVEGLRACKPRLCERRRGSSFHCCPPLFSS